MFTRSQKGEIPYTIEQSDQVFTPILNKSYSPTSKMESMQLNEHGHRLSDIVRDRIIIES